MKVSRVTHHGKKCWQAQWFDSGKRSRRYFESKAKASKWVKRWESERTQIGREWASVSDSVRSEMMTAWERSQRGGYSLHQACDAFEKVQPSKCERVEIGKAVAGFIAAKRGQNLKEFSLGLMECSLGRLADKFPGQCVCDLSLTDVERYLSERGGSAKSRKNWIGELSGFFRWCVDRGFAASNIAAAIPPPILTRDTPSCLTVDQCRKLLDRCRKDDPKLLALVSLCLFAGVRTGEAKLLTWASIDLKALHVTVGADIAKTRRRRIIPISPNLSEWLKLGGDLPLGRVDDRVAKIRRLAGITSWPRNVMRHTFCSMHLAAHGSAAQTALVAGHSESMLFQHYRELVTRSEAERFWQLSPKQDTQ